MRSSFWLMAGWVFAAGCDRGEAVTDRTGSVAMGATTTGAAVVGSVKASAPMTKAPVVTATATAAVSTAPAHTAAPAGDVAGYQANGYPVAMPHTRSAMPTAAEWDKAPPVTTKKLPAGCSSKFVREWLQILCVKVAGAPAPVEVEKPGSLFGKMSQFGQPDADVGMVSTKGERVELLARTMPENMRKGEDAGAEGLPATTHFRMAGALYTVGYHWSKGAPFPSVMFLAGSEKVPGAGSFTLDCKASSECGVGMMCCVTGGGAMGSNCTSAATQCDIQSQTRTCATDADCQDWPPATMHTAVKLSRCGVTKGSPKNTPRFCAEPKDVVR